MNRVYSIIVTYNGAKLIEKCLDSLINSTIQTSLIVIDNNSSDNTSSIVKEKYPEVHFIQSPKNLGFGKANNIGLRKAYQEGADYVFLLNQDAWVEPDTIEKLIKVSLTNKKNGILAPINLSIDGTLEHSFQEELNTNNCPDILSDLFINNLKQVYPVTRYINASCWLLTKECIQTVGGFDPIFSHYGEDVDYCQRAIFHGFSVDVCTITKNYHAKVNFKRKQGKFRDLLNKTKRNYLNNFLFLNFKDLNLNLFSNYIFESITLVLLIFKYLIKFSFNYSFIYVIILYKLQIKLPIIWLHRKKCRKKYPTFI